MSHAIEQITYQLTWQIRHEVMWPDQPFDFIKLPEDPEGIHYGVFDQNRLWTVVSVFRQDDEAQFRKLATRQEAQGKGYATALLRYVFEDLDVLGVKRIWCNARAEKMAFYERFGMSITDQTYEKKGIQFVVMEKYL